MPKPLLYDPPRVPRLSMIAAWAAEAEPARTRPAQWRRLQDVCCIVPPEIPGSMGEAGTGWPPGAHPNRAPPRRCGEEPNQPNRSGPANYQGTAIRISPDTPRYRARLSIGQPFAELILRGIETVAYRSRPTRTASRSP